MFIPCSIPVPSRFTKLLASYFISSLVLSRTKSRLQFGITCVWPTMGAHSAFQSSRSKRKLLFFPMENISYQKSNVRGMSLEYVPLVLGFSRASPVKVFCMQPQIPMLKSTTTRYFLKVLFPPSQPWPPPLTISPHTSRVVLKLWWGRMQHTCPTI